MKRIRVIPILLLKDDGLVKTMCFRRPTYIGDPINAVKIFNEKEVDEIALLDISASMQNREPNYEKIREICSEAFMPFAYGGGIKNIDQIKRLFNVGIEKVIINSAAFYHPTLIEQAATIYGSQSITISMDVKKNFFGKRHVFVGAGQINTKTPPMEYAKQMESYGAGEIILTSIDHEGTYKGYPLDLIQEVSHAVGIPVVANGGASSLQSFFTAVEAGASAVSAGSVFVFHGKRRGILINYPSQNTLTEHLYKKL